MSELSKLLQSADVPMLKGFEVRGYWRSDNRKENMQTSLWRAADFFGVQRELAYWIAVPVIILFLIVLLRTNIERKGELLLGFALAANLVISPYTLGSHYVLLAPVFVMIALRFPWFLLLWLLTLSPLLRLVGGFELAWIDIVYPLALMIITLVLIWRGEAVKQNGADPVLS